jgi:hypothetical protein
MKQRTFFLYLAYPGYFPSEMDVLKSELPLNKRTSSGKTIHDH